jgi:hypothetical protein
MIEPMRKENPQFRWHVTDAEKAEIRRLTKAGMRQSEIARRLGITAPSVSKAQRANGLPTKLIWPETKIVSLFKRGWGGYRIAKHLHVPVNQVYSIAHAHHINNGWAKTPEENEARFIEALKRGDDYVKRLAIKYMVAFCRANRIAHEVLKTIEFRPGLSKPPLSSNFPQTNHRRGPLST